MVTVPIVATCFNNNLPNYFNNMLQQCRLLRGIFGPKRVCVRGERWMLHNEELRILY
jgi:hypothetical protein